MPQIIIQTDIDINNKLINKSKELNMSKADLIIEIIKKYFGGKNDV